MPRRIVQFCGRCTGSGTGSLSTSAMCPTTPSIVICRSATTAISSCTPPGTPSAARPLAEAAESDVVVTASYVPEGARIADALLSLDGPLRVFYDLDTPITLQRLAEGDLDYLRARQLRGLRPCALLDGRRGARRAGARFRRQGWRARSSAAWTRMSIARCCRVPTCVASSATWAPTLRTARPSWSPCSWSPPGGVLLRGFCSPVRSIPGVAVACECAPLRTRSPGRSSGALLLLAPHAQSDPRGDGGFRLLPLGTIL